MTSNQIAFANYKETVRNNKFQNKESKRHNKEQEKIGYSNVALGYANLNETVRHDYASESINQQLADINQQNANINQQNADTKEGELEEKARKNDIDYQGIIIKGMSAGVVGAVTTPLVVGGYAVSNAVENYKNGTYSWDMSRLTNRASNK